MDVLKTRLNGSHYQRLERIDNPQLHQFIAKYVELCNPDKVFVCTDSPEDVQYIKKVAIENGEESELAIPGHTIHFDSYYDQGRDKENTRILVSKGVDLGSSISTRDRDEGLREIYKILKDIMSGHELYVCFFCLGPTNSEFSLPCVQLTDSSYVAHNEHLLYRSGYEEFIREGPSARFFKFVHSQGELNERKVSRNLEKRRIYIDIESDTVYSTNTQYGGNSIGLKKLAMRLAINRASEEGWLTEHMFIMAIHGPRSRATYFNGAFPSLCGKTSTAMLEGETIVGDDIAYIRKKNGEVRAVNAENGMFGIIEGVNSKDDPILWRVLNSPGEIIFSNVLVTDDKRVHWIGKNGEVPPRGYNHSGEWWIGKRDDKGREIPPSHPNARFTINMRLLTNLDLRLDDPNGIMVGGIVYGGRDSDTWVPVEEAFDWAHGMITKGACLESETTAATLGKEGIRELNPMSNLDFLSIPLGRYIQNNLEFGKDLRNPPLIFSVNYFLKGKDGRFLNEKTDKKVWYKWMELRVHKEVGAIKTPTGLIPEYQDLKRLFRDVLDKDYLGEDYIKQFTIRVPENLVKIDRVANYYKTKVHDTSQVLFEVLEEQRRRLIEARERYGDNISPNRFLTH
ncbi:MAG: phosphoenolpyruvate carboxykinase (GTP) [Nitrososphaerales archaeon]|nr:phosphoenolpyruvate carboxykinase (GTP) [Nitrososphaerales archaeon]